MASILKIVKTFYILHLHAEMIYIVALGNIKDVDFLVLYVAIILSNKS